MRYHINNIFTNQITSSLNVICSLKFSKDKTHYQSKTHTFQTLSKCLYCTCADPESFVSGGLTLSLFECVFIDF